MKETKITEGSYIKYEVTGNIISFNDGDLMLNLARYERDFEIVVDICKNELGNLLIGVDNKKGTYVAQIIIPARKYSIEKGELDENDTHIEIKSEVAFDINNTQINLWGV